MTLNRIFCCVQFSKPLVLVALTLSSLTAEAHKRWLLPTDFSLSQAEWVSVEYTASNNIFYVDKSMPLNDVKLYTPKGKTLALENVSQGKRRSSFDVLVKEQGTYRVTTGGEPMYFVSYSLPGNSETQRARGSLEKLASELPKNAEKLQYMASVSRIETYITLGKPSSVKPKTKEAGISVNFIHHPNAIYADEPAEFQFLVDGKPGKNLVVSVISEGTRYRDVQAQVDLKADADGKVSITWPNAGRYLIEVNADVAPSDKRIAKKMYSYYLTLDVLAP